MISCYVFLTNSADLEINFLILTSGNLKSLRVRCIVKFLVRWENLTAISFHGFGDRCQYLTWEKKEVVESPWRKYTSVQTVHVLHICKTILHSHTFEEYLPMFIHLCYLPATCRRVKYSYPHPPTSTHQQPLGRDKAVTCSRRQAWGGPHHLPSPLPKVKTVTCSRRQAWWGPPPRCTRPGTSPQVDSPRDLSY